MRLHDLERVDVPKPASSKSSRAVAIGAVVAIALAAAGGWMWWASKTPALVEGPAPVEPLDGDRLLAYVTRDRATTLPFAALFASNDAIETFAERAVSGKSSSIDKARGVAAAIAEFASKRGYVQRAFTEPRSTALRNAADTLAAISAEGAADRAYPLELAVLAASALREEDVPAMVASVSSFAGDRTPADPSGYVGYFVIALPKSDAEPREWTYVDVFGGRTAAPADGSVRVLSDVEVVANAYAIEAMRTLVHEGGSARALELADAAARIGPRLPEVRSVRGAVVLTSGNAEEGIREFESALELRDDSPRHANLATLLLMKGDMDGALRHVNAALEATPDFAGGHGTLAAIHLSQRSSEAALRELETASRLDPDLQTLPMLYANYYAMEGDMPRAIEYARNAASRRAHDPQTHLLLAQLLRQSGSYDEMRAEARKALELVPAAQQDAMRQLITQMLGPTALEDEAEAEEAEAEEGADEEGPGELRLDQLPEMPSGDLRLGAGSRLLDEEDAPAAPSQAGEGGPLLRLGDTTKLRLGAPSEGLRLNLQE